jgi:5-methylcytosine-specific restriction endonuclease McrA
VARGDGREGPFSELYRSAAWKRVRKFVLERDAGRCKIRGRKCKGVATEVDHIVRLVDGGAALDPDNLRASCRPCNRGRRPGVSQATPRAGVPASREW